MPIITNVLLDRNGEGPIYPVKGPLKAHSGCPYRDSTSVSSHPPPPQPYPGHAGTVSAVVLQADPKIRLFMGNNFSRISTLHWFMAWGSKRVGVRVGVAYRCYKYLTYQKNPCKLHAHFSSNQSGPWALCTCMDSTHQVNGGRGHAGTARQIRVGLDRVD